jgi:glycosyltransferase involved in cell wall biosynthesis
MRALVWHWGRRGAGPIFAARLAEALNALPGHGAALSLAAGAELLAAPDAPACAWPEPTYASPLGFIAQRAAGPFLRPRITANLRRLAPDIAICAMPALLDGRMLAGLRGLELDYAVIVHDAEAHPGDALSFRALGQNRLLRGARHLFCLTRHVELSLRRQGFGENGQSLTKLWHPPLDFAATVPAAMPTTRPRILHFGRLLPYKGLDLLADALTLLGNDRPFELRICGEGPKSSSLDRLQAMPGVSVERRWIADSEISGLLAWSDALVLPYREASQSGVAALALAAGRHVLATAVGGLPEQLGGQPNTLLCAPNPKAIAQALRELTWRLAQPVPAPVLADAGADWQAMAAAMAGALSLAPQRLQSAEDLAHAI